MGNWNRKRQELRKHRLRNILLNAVCVLLAGSGLWATADYFWRHVNYVVTNDAFVDQYVAPLNIRVAGYVREVRFTEHRFVREGDTLLILDDREYRIRVKEAEAALLDARGTQGVIHSGIETSRTNVAVQEANIAEARAKLWQTEQDFRRFERLLRDESVPGQQYEQAKAAYEAAEARYRALVAQKEAARSQYAEASRRTVGAEANILRREADLDMARLNLSYTVLTAPYDGYIGRRTLEPGQFVQAGQTVSYLVRNRDKYITANYKETQIAHIHIGQEVVVKVDAFPGRRFRGRVTAISEATGSKYALVPTDNSAGNFVKVQQRIPVRIDLEGISDEEMDLLRAGMMVETEARRRCLQPPPWNCPSADGFPTGWPWRGCSPSCCPSPCSTAPTQGACSKCRTRWVPMRKTSRWATMPLRPAWPSPTPSCRRSSARSPPKCCCWRT